MATQVHGFHLGVTTFVTLAVKSVIAADTLSELVQLFSYFGEGNREGRTMDHWHTAAGMGHAR